VNVTHFLLCEIVVGFCCSFCFLAISLVLWLFLVFIGYPLLLSIVGYCTPFFLLWFFCDGQCYHSVYIVCESCYFMLIWMVRAKLNSGISGCGFSIDTYVNVVVLSTYRNDQIIYWVIFLSRHFELKVIIYVVYLM